MLRVAVIGNIMLGFLVGSCAISLELLLEGNVVRAVE